MKMVAGPSVGGICSSGAPHRTHTLSGCLYCSAGSSGRGEGESERNAARPTMSAKARGARLLRSNGEARRGGAALQYTARYGLCCDQSQGSQSTRSSLSRPLLSSSSSDLHPFPPPPPGTSRHLSPRTATETTSALPLCVLLVDDKCSATLAQASLGSSSSTAPLFGTATSASSHSSRQGRPLFCSRRGAPLQREERSECVPGPSTSSSSPAVLFLPARNPTSASSTSTCTCATSGGTKTS